jgi:hypothetical protein
VDSFWSNEEVAGGLRKLSRAVKKAAGTGLVDSDASHIRRLANLVRILERRDRCRVPPDIGIQSGTRGWSFYLDCTDARVAARLFGEESFPDGDRMITEGHEAKWDLRHKTLASERALLRICEVLESTGPWSFRIGSDLNFND